MSSQGSSSPVLRGLAVLTAFAVGACAVAPGPAEQQAAYAAQACQQGSQQACADYQSLYYAAAEERAYRQQAADAQVGTAVAVGALGLAAGAVIAGSSRGYHRGHYGRGYHRHRHRY